MSSVAAKSANAQACVLAFEPQPNVFAALETDNDINRYDVRCLNLALSDSSGVLPFYNDGKHAFASGNTTAGGPNKSWRTDGQQCIEVALARLDEVLAAEGVARVDPLKIDVETFEFEVLAGCGGRLATDQPIVILEIRSREIGEKVASLFDRAAYSFWHIDESEGLSEVQALSGEEPDENYLLCPRRKLDAVRPFVATPRT